MQSSPPNRCSQRFSGLLSLRHWRLASLLCLGVGVLVASLSWAYAAEPSEDVKELRAMLAEANNAVDSTAKLEILKPAAEKVAASHPKNVMITEWVAAGLKQAEGNEPAAAVDALEKSLQEVESILLFEPKMEAPLPVGFPAVTPLGEIRVKEYPEYRLARAASKNTNAFGTLFRHIKKKDIEMTAPVEMTFASDTKGEQPEETAMAFLYRSTEQGETGADGRVEIVDVPAMKTVTIGMRGTSSGAGIAAAEKRLRAWLAANEEYMIAGEMRVMGYNSPFMPNSRKYFEVEFPIEKRTSTDGAND